MNLFTLIPYAVLFVIIAGILWFLFSSKKEQAHIVTEVNEKLHDGADATGDARDVLRKDLGLANPVPAVPVTDPSATSTAPTA